MKNLGTHLLICIALFFSTVHVAHASEELAKKNGCLACHAVDEKVVGPSLKEIAKKYATQDGAGVKMAETIIKGGAGAWGNVPMPPQPQLSATDAKALAAWVLAIK
jgi:cytochrome c